MRRLDGPTLVEVVAIASRADEPVVCEVRIGLAADGAPISDVKSGHLDREGAAPQVSADAVAFSLDRHTTTVAMSPAPTRVEVGAAAPGDAATAVFELVVDPGDAVEVALTVGVRRTAASALDADPGSDAVAWSPRPGGGCRPAQGRCSRRPSTTCATCCCATPRPPPTSSPQGTRGTSRSSAATRCGRPG